MSVIITVQSVVYNLAGDEIDRIHYLRSLVMRNVLSGTKDTIADTLRNGYLNGPGIQMRSFYRWADNPDHFGSIGMPSGKMEVLGDVDTTAIAAHISSPPGTSVWVQNARAGYADLLMWAKRWIYANRPDDADGDWEVDYDAETQILTITFDPEDPADPLNENWVPTDIQQIVLTDFDPDLVYIYAFYTIVTGEQFGPYEEGDRIVLDPGEAFPSTSGWEENGLWSDTPSVSLDRHERDTTTITYSYSDGRPDDVVTTVGDWTTTTSQTTTTHLDNWYKKTTNTSSGNSITRLHEHMNQIQNHTINSVSSETTSTTTEETTWNDGTETDPVWVTMTTTTETTTEIWQDEIEVTREYQIDTQTETIRAYSDTLLMIYQIGSGECCSRHRGDTGRGLQGILPGDPGADQQHLSVGEQLADPVCPGQEGLQESRGREFRQAGRCPEGEQEHQGDGLRVHQVRGCPERARQFLPALHLHLPREDDGNPIREPGGLPGLEGMAGRAARAQGSLGRMVLQRQPDG